MKKLKDINHKRPDLDSIIDFLTKTTTYNINKEALADLMKQNIIIKKNYLKSVILITISNKTKKTTKTIINLITLQQPVHSFNETDINTLCSFQQLAPEITTDTTSLNTATETSPTVPTDIQTPIATSNLNDTSNFTQKFIIKIEAQLSVLKSYVDYELSTLPSKIEAFSDSLKNALANRHKRKSNYTNTDLLQQNIIFLENELKSKDRITQ